MIQERHGVFSIEHSRSIKSKYLLSSTGKKQRFSLLEVFSLHLHCLIGRSFCQSEKYSDVLFYWRKKSIMEHRKELVSPSIQDILAEMETSHTYEGIFSETWKLLNIMLALPVSTASVERSFRQMKLIKTRLRSRLSDMNLEHLMKIAIEGPPLTDVDFSEILDIFKQKNRHISL